jgi:hypothetical protein
MKKLLIAAVSFFIVSATVFAENPFLGKWNVEMLGSADGMVWIFNDTTIDVQSADGSVSTESYTLDQDAREITLSSAGSSLRVRYRIDGDKIDFIVTDLENSPFYSSINELYGSMRGVNNLTDEVALSIKREFAKFVLDMPIMRLSLAQKYE